MGDTQKRIKLIVSLSGDYLRWLDGHRSTNTIGGEVMNLTRSSEEKKAYFSSLRARWQEAKALADHDAIGAIIKAHGLNISVVGYCVVAAQMAALGYDGLPYLDMKTYQGWKESGFQVKRGEHANVDGITWINSKGKETENGETESTFAFPKVYKLFHRSQVEAINN